MRPIGRRDPRRRLAFTSDAHELRRITYLPRALLSILWTALTLLALCVGCLRLA